MEAVCKHDINVYRENSIRGVYFCPKCFRTVHVITPNVTLFEGISSDADIETPVLSLQLLIDCPDCSNQMVPIDDTLEDIIVTLNKKGLITAAYCEGHIKYMDGYIRDGYIRDIPYIYFKGINHSFANMIRNFISSWKADSNLDFVRDDSIELQEEYGKESKFIIYYKNYKTIDGECGIEYIEKYLERANLFFKKISELSTE